MRRIRSRDTAPEMALRKALFANGLRYRCGRKDLPGKPDVTFGPARVAVFVNGCFWHQHPGCHRATTPATNISYWAPKLQRNVERDRSVRAKLEALGYLVVTIWECEIKDDVIAVASRVQKVVNGRRT